MTLRELITSLVVTHKVTSGIYFMIDLVALIYILPPKVDRFHHLTANLMHDVGIDCIVFIDFDSRNRSKLQTSAETAHTGSPLVLE